MNENRIQQVLDVEKQAQAIYDAAVNEADKMPRQAEIEAQALIERARSEAEEEARRMVDSSQVEEEINRILSQADERNRRMESLAKSNFDKAVAFVLTRIAGKE